MQLSTHAQRLLDVAVVVNRVAIIDALSAVLPAALLASVGEANRYAPPVGCEGCDRPRTAADNPPDHGFSRPGAVANSYPARPTSGLLRGLLSRDSKRRLGAGHEGMASPLLRSNPLCILCTLQATRS